VEEFPPRPIPLVGDTYRIVELSYRGIHPAEGRVLAIHGPFAIIGGIEDEGENSVPEPGTVTRRIPLNALMKIPDLRQK
jgi:hypothetical protein